MSRTRKVYSVAFKTKVVLETLKEDCTMNEIASEYKVTSKKYPKLQSKVFSKCSDGNEAFFGSQRV